MSELYKGSCLCGQIRFEVSGTLGDIGHCHCKMCQKGHGAAFATYVNVSRDNFSLVAGEFSSYESSPGIERKFCPNCGSSIQFVRHGGMKIGIAAGCFDTDIGKTANYQIWTSAQAPWGSVDNTEMSHATHPTRPDASSNSQLE